MRNYNEISTTDLLSLINNTNRKIIDIRSVNSYNGWRENGESRKGHILKAINLPFEWIIHSSWNKLLLVKELNPDQTIVVYGYDRKEIEITAEKLIQNGFLNVSVYLHFVVDWCRDESYPMEHLTRYNQLVSVKWLQRQIEDKKTKEYVLCHCHYENRQSYLKGHIPGAIELNTTVLESSDTWNRRSPDELKMALEQLGISCDTTVVLYGEHSDSLYANGFNEKNVGQMAAFRCALIMLYAGVKDVKILNGGFNSWIESSGRISQEEEPSVPITQFGKRIPINKEYIIDRKEARDYLSSEYKNLVSIRSWPEYIGKVSGYSYITKKGRIPGALFSNFGSDAYHMENYRNFDQTCREYGAIKKMWCQSGIFRNGTYAFYCGTGWKASEAWFNAYLMGWENISIYDGGWFEWSQDEKNPIETGNPEKNQKKSF